MISTRGGLRAKEIACLKWNMLLASDGTLGEEIHLTNEASKGATGGRVIPMTTAQAIVNQFQVWYKIFGLVGCSSHAGRRTFITNTARKISTVGGSLKDIQMLAGHSSLQTTQRYIDENKDAKRKVVDLV